MHRPYGDVSPYLYLPMRTLHAACHERRDSAGAACRNCAIRDICDTQRLNDPPATRTYVVGVPHAASDLRELLADIRIWLDHRHIEAGESRELRKGDAVALIGGFRAAADAAAFAEAFRGSMRLDNAASA